MSKSGTPGHSIGVAAEELAAALARHSRVMIDNPDDVPRVVLAGFDLREAVLTYANAVRHKAGWGDPFHDLYRFEDPEEEEPRDGNGKAVHEHLGLSVTLRSDFLPANDRSVAELAEKLGLPDSAAEAVLSELIMRHYAPSSWAPAVFVDIRTRWRVFETGGTVPE